MRPKYKVDGGEIFILQRSSVMEMFIKILEVNSFPVVDGWFCPILRKKGK